MPGLDFDTSDVLRNILAPAADDDASALLSAAIFRPNDITPKAFDFDKLTTVDVGAGSSGHPPKQTTVDGRTESLSKLPTRLLLDAWSVTYGHRLTGVQIGMVKFVCRRFQSCFDVLAME